MHGRIHNSFSYQLQKISDISVIIYFFCYSMTKFDNLLGNLITGSSFSSNNADTRYNLTPLTFLHVLQQSAHLISGGKKERKLLPKKKKHEKKAPTPHHISLKNQQITVQLFKLLWQEDELGMHNAGGW